MNPDPPAWLASADRDGHDRYRVPAIGSYSEGAALLLAGGKVLISKYAQLAAYDAASGALSWSIDQSKVYPGRAQVQGLADLGDGKIAFAMYEYGQASGVYIAEL